MIDFYLTFINNNNSIRPLEYIESLDFGYDEQKKILFLKNKIEEIFSNIPDSHKITLIVNIKFISIYKNLYSNEDIRNILKDYYEFFNIRCENDNNCNVSITHIDFINENVKKCFNSLFDSILCNLISENKLGLFDNILNKSMECILLEKQIILQLVSTFFFKILKINRIYCCNNFPSFDINENENIIIIQSLDNAPIYDFAVIIYINNMPILKVYQVGINKENVYLKKLDIDIIKYDLELFIKYIKEYLGIRIQYYTFGIITTKNAYIQNISMKENNIEDFSYVKNINELIERFNGENPERTYKNYYKMKEFCEANKYEFLVFDKNDKNFYIHEKNNSLKKINFLNSYNEKVKIRVEDLYNAINIKNIIKMYYSRNDYYFFEEKIKTIIKGNLKIKIIGKFNFLNQEIPRVEGKNLFLCWEDIRNGHFYIINDRKINSNNNFENISFKGAYFIAFIITGVKRGKKKYKIIIPTKNNNDDYEDEEMEEIE